MCIRCLKIEYIRCNFSEIEQPRDSKVTIGEDIISCLTKFKYLGWVIQNSGGIDDDVTYWIQEGCWVKGRAATEVLCDMKFLITLKGKFYRVAIKHAMFYRT